MSAFPGTWRQFGVLRSIVTESGLEPTQTGTKATEGQNRLSSGETERELNLCLSTENVDNIWSRPQKNDRKTEWSGTEWNKLNTAQS